MFQTFKLCNMRDCKAHDVEKVPFDAVDPCRVFWHEESSMWYDELTGTTVPMHAHGDGTFFDTQAWLLGQAQKAMTAWKPGVKVHEAYKRHAMKTKPSKSAAEAPEYTCQELDQLASAFITSRQDSNDAMDEINRIGHEIRGYTRMQKKWDDNPMISRHVEQLREDRKQLQHIVKKWFDTSDAARTHLKAENKWTDRWVPKKNFWKDTVLFWSDPKTKSIWSIDRNGLRLRGHYIHLPETDSAFIECANYAATQFGIPKSEWKKQGVEAERIGASLKRYGKKNANGARINMRFDQKKYAESCLQMVKHMKLLGIDVDQFVESDELYEFYWKNIAPKLQRQ
jgi:hypothetical protein